jgi:energy-converting hydrogenase Eha subunit A
MQNLLRLGYEKILLLAAVIFRGGITVLIKILLPIYEPDRPIFEPFMGSGITVIAVLNAGREIDAIESDPAIFNAAVARIEQHLQQQAA